jgi:antitoxin component YwqK of YwqJK toxin-antitoxin module
MSRFLSYILAVSCVFSSIHGVQDDKVVPVAEALKQRQPHWRPKIIETFPNGNPATVLFYEQISSEREAPVKQIKYYPEGQIRNEMDLIEVDQSSEGFKEWKTDVVPHGVSLSFFINGAVEKALHYDRGILHGDVQVFYPEGKLKAQGSFKCGKRHGLMISYYEDGEKSEEATYVDGALEKDLIRYHSKGIRSNVIPYKKGLPHGTALEWYESGALKASATYNNGVLHSDGKTPAYVMYNEDRAIIEVQDYKNGQPTGTHFKYHPSGKESYKISFKSGKKHGQEQYFAADGKLMGDGVYVDGVAVGKHYRNYENGRLAFLATFDEKGNLLESIKEYFDNGQIKSEYFTQDAERDGSFKEWYDNGQIKTEYFYVRGQFDGEQKEYYANGHIKLKTFYKNKVKDGLYEEWYENGKPALQTTLKEDVKYGPSKGWYENGKLAFEEMYLEGKLNLERKEWYESGTLKFSGSYAQGMKEGAFKEWDDKGSVTLEATFKNDLPEGKLLVFYEKGKLKESLFFINGKKHGKNEEYYENGKMKASAHYLQDRLDGKVLAWHEDGSPWFVKMYKNGVCVGEQIEYFSKDMIEGKESQKVSKIFLYNEKGEMEGAQKTFYPTGGIQTIITYRDGELNGAKSLYDPSGSLLEDATYENGKLNGRFFQMMQDGKEVVYHYVNNRREGLHQIFYPEQEVVGKVKAFEVAFVDDMPEGEAKEFDANGFLLSSTFYVKGLKEGVAKVYHPKGQELVSLEFHDDKKNGPMMQFFPNGMTYKEAMFANDVQVGTEKTYFEDGKLASLIEYSEGKIHGNYKQWNPSGILTFEGEYKNGLRHGSVNKFYDDGRPHLLQSFVDDKLHGVKRSYDESGKLTETKFEHGQKVR